VKISDAVDVRRDYQRRLCEALGLDPAVTVDVTVNEAEYRVEWETSAAVDLNDYGWMRLEMGGYPVVGLTPGNQITYEAWDEVLRIKRGWIEQFPTAP